MRPTPRALELAEPVAEALEQVRRALERHGAFDPAMSHRHFYIVSNEYADFMLLMKVLPVLRTAAPQTSLDVRAGDEAGAIELLDHGIADLAVGCFRHAPKRLRSEPLYEERCVCIARRDHPDLIGGLTLENFVRLPHLVVSAARNPTHMVDDALRSDGLRRHIVQTIHSFAVVPHLLEVSDLVAVVGDRVGRRIASTTRSIAVYDLPFPMLPWKVDMLWSRRTEADPALAWLRRCFHDTGAGL
jgi:DNA-binding transcriptional LysR family regulator